MTFALLPKPFMRRTGLHWLCHGHGVSHYGSTQAQAYRKWRTRYLAWFGGWLL